MRRAGSSSTSTATRSASSRTATRFTPSTTAARTWASRSIAARSPTGSSRATGTTLASTSAPAARSTSGPTTCAASRSRSRGDDVLVDLTPLDDPLAHQQRAAARRAASGTSRSCSRKRRSRSTRPIRPASDAFRAGLEFGVARRGGGWFRGLTTLIVLDEPRAQARLSRTVPRRSTTGWPTWPATPAGEPPRFRSTRSRARQTDRSWRGWFRGFVEVRDAEGAERALVSAARGGRSPPAARGHALRSRDRPPLPRRRAHARLRQQGARGARCRRLGARGGRCSLRSPPQLAGAERMEEANAWRNPVDLVALLDDGRSSELPRRSRRAIAVGGWTGARSSSTRCSRPRPGRRASRRCSRRSATARSEVELASAVSFAAVTRIARFPTSNEFGDWDTALHTFTFANAVEQGLRRSPSPELLRGVLRRRDERPPRPLPQRAGRAKAAGA